MQGGLSDLEVTACIHLPCGELLLAPLLIGLGGRF